MDLFRCESSLLRGHWVRVVIDVFTRRISGFGVRDEAIDGPALCRMFNHASAGHPPHVRIGTDYDPLFRFYRWSANLRILEVAEIESVPYVPMSHPFVERLIGTIRREYLDHTLFCNSIDLHRKLGKFQIYYNRFRVHRPIDGHMSLYRAANVSFAKANFTRHAWERHCNRFLEIPVAA